MAYDKFLEVFFDELHGVDVRFRNRQFTLDDDEIVVIKEFIGDVARKLRDTGSIDANDAKKVVKVIETLEKSSEEDSMALLQYIYAKFDEIN